MKEFRRLLVFLILVCLCLTACGGEASPTAPSDEDTFPAQVIDYAASVKLDMSSDTAKQEVTVKTFVDGDTTHFYVPESVMEGGVLKARYLAINTPESTGKIEEYGKKASQFTREKLSEAVSIIIESETGSWDPDSTGDRYLVWVWYKTAGMEEYRNLNIELLCNFNGIGYRLLVSFGNIGVEITDIQIFVKVNGVINAVLCCHAFEIIRIRFLELILRQIHIQFNKIKSQLRTQPCTFAECVCFNQCGHTVIFDWHFHHLYFNIKTAVSCFCMVRRMQSVVCSSQSAPNRGRTVYFAGSRISASPSLVACMPTKPLPQ